MQLEEFGRAVKSSYPTNSSANDAKDRHKDFIIAIEDQIRRVESSLNESTISRGKPPLPWVRLDEGERHELQLFLSGLPSSSDQQTLNECSRSSSNLVDLAQMEGKDENYPGHRRTASANADIGSWKIVVVDDDLPHDSCAIKPDPPPRRIPSFSGILNTMESSMSQLKWPKNGYKKLKLTDRPQEAGSILPRPQNLTRVSY